MFAEVSISIQYYQDLIISDFFLVLTKKISDDTTEIQIHSDEIALVLWKGRNRTPLAANPKQQRTEKKAIPSAHWKVFLQGPPPSRCKYGEFHPIKHGTEVPEVHGLNRLNLQVSAPFMVFHVESTFFKSTLW